MYICKEHGKEEVETVHRCALCGKECICDCTDRIETRFENLPYDCAEGKRTATMWLRHCNTCGKVFDAFASQS